MYEHERKGPISQWPEEIYSYRTRTDKWNSVEKKKKNKMLAKPLKLTK